MFLCILFFCSLTVTGARTAKADPGSLASTYQPQLKIGVAVGESLWSDSERATRILCEREYNSSTPENFLKWDAVQPEPGKFNWAAPDRWVQWGEQHQLQLVGHVLVWHQQTPDWVFRDDSAAPRGRDSLHALLRNHIATVVGRYRGRIDIWDVVNEAIEDDGSRRDSPWLQILGDNYVADAFQLAHQADPTARLLYNDYNVWMPEKRAGIIRLLQEVRSSGAPVHGIGMQGHWGLHYPTVEELQSTLKSFSELNFEIHITELDITVLPDPSSIPTADIASHFDYNETMDPYQEGLPPELSDQLATRYEQLFKVFLEFPEVVRVTFWGATDKLSWRNDFPISGRTDHPLLFDRAGQPKKAYKALLRLRQ